MSERASGAAAHSDLAAAEYAVEAVRPRARRRRPRSSSRLATLAGVTVLMALAVIGFASIQRGGAAPVTVGESSGGVTPAFKPQWPVGPVTSGPASSAVPSAAASPSASGAAGPAPGGKPGAPARTAGGGAGITPAAPSPTGAGVSLIVGSRAGLEPVSRPGYRVRHYNFAGRIDPIGPGSSALDRADSTFTVRNGLAGSGCVSFEAVNYPGYYLRHRNFEIYLHRRDGGQTFDADATFCEVPAGQHIALRSYNYPSHYLNHRDSRLYISGGAATFTVV